MSASRRKFSTEFKVEVAHRVIDSGRSINEVVRELGVLELSLRNWVRAEHRRIEAAKGTGLDLLGGTERVELLRLRKQVTSPLVLHELTSPAQLLSLMQAIWFRSYVF